MMIHWNTNHDFGDGGKNHDERKIIDKRKMILGGGLEKNKNYIEKGAKLK